MPNGWVKNKKDLIDLIAGQTDLKKKQSVDFVESFFESIGKALKKGDQVTLVGFGTFKVVKRKARAGRNPATGKPIKIAARKVPRFLAGKVLKDTVRRVKG